MACRTAAPRPLGRQSLAGAGAAPPRARAAAPARALDPDNTSVLVAGGGGVALDVTRRLKDRGSWVWMLQRTAARQSIIEGMVRPPSPPPFPPLSSPGRRPEALTAPPVPLVPPQMAIHAPGDAMDPASIERIMEEIDEVDAVVSTVGGTPADPAADSEGNINLIKAAVAKGVQKFVLVTSIGAGDSKAAAPPQVYESLEPVLVEKTKAEEFLMAQGDKIEYVIVRPGGLKSEPYTGTGILTEDASVLGAVNRDDVAELVCRTLFSDEAKNKVYSCIDTAQMFTEEEREIETVNI